MNSVEKIGRETFVRQFSREKSNLKKLANHLNYNSRELDYLLSLLPDIEDKVPNSFEDVEDPKNDDEEVIY